MPHMTTSQDSGFVVLQDPRTTAIHTISRKGLDDALRLGETLLSEHTCLKAAHEAAVQAIIERDALCGGTVFVVNGRPCVKRDGQYVPVSALATA